MIKLDKLKIKLLFIQLLIVNIIFFIFFINIEYAGH